MFFLNGGGFGITEVEIFKTRFHTTMFFLNRNIVFPHLKGRHYGFHTTMFFLNDINRISITNCVSSFPYNNVLLKRRKN